MDGRIYRRMDEWEAERWCENRQKMERLTSIKLSKEKVKRYKRSMNYE